MYENFDCVTTDLTNILNKFFSNNRDLIEKYEKIYENNIKNQYPTLRVLDFIKTLINNFKNSSSLYTVISIVTNYFKGQLQKTTERNRSDLVEISNEFYKINTPKTIKILKNSEDKVLKSSIIIKDLVKIIKRIFPTANEAYIKEHLFVVY